MKSYRRFLMDLHEELVRAILEAEDQEWHHWGELTVEFQHYVRLNTWAKELSERRQHLDNADIQRAWKRHRRGAPPA